MLQFQIVAGAGTVDYFDGHSWTHQNGKLQFFDTNYAMSGWHGMDEFAVEYYDGVGYDGEPLKVVDGWVAVPSDPEEANGPFVLNTLTATGQTPNPPPPDAVVTEWKTAVYGQWSEKLLANWEVSNPSPGYNPDDTFQKPLTVAFISTDDLITPRPADLSDEDWAKVQSDVVQYFQDCLVSDGISVTYNKKMTMDNMVSYIQIISERFDQPIENLLVAQHADVGYVKMGATKINTLHFKDYAPLFNKMGQVLSGASAQIQFYECNVAGVNFLLPHDGYTSDELIFESVGGRALLRSIADSTGATVFGSSDKVGIDYDEKHMVVRGPIDACLEFCVSPGGTQPACTTLRTCLVDYNTGKSFQEFDMSRPDDFLPNLNTIPTEGEPEQPGWVWMDASQWASKYYEKLRQR